MHELQTSTEFGWRRQLGHIETSSDKVSSSLRPWSNWGAEWMLFGIYYSPCKRWKEGSEVVQVGGRLENSVCSQLAPQWWLSICLTLLKNSPCSAYCVNWPCCDSTSWAPFFYKALLISSVFGNACLLLSAEGCGCGWWESSDCWRLQTLIWKASQHEAPLAKKIADSVYVLFHPTMYSQLQTACHLFGQLPWVSA